MTCLSSAVMSSMAFDLMLVCLFSLPFLGGRPNESLPLLCRLLMEPILIFLGVASPGCYVREKLTSMERFGSAT
jgi:hypothetical protein